MSILGQVEKGASIDPSLIPKSSPGRPRLTTELSSQLEAIVSIAIANENKVAADPRRRTEVIRS